jgi:hypothetical protein
LQWMSDDCNVYSEKERPNQNQRPEYFGKTDFDFFITVILSFSLNRVWTVLPWKASKCNTNSEKVRPTPLCSTTVGLSFFKEGVRMYCSGSQVNVMKIQRKKANFVFWLNHCRDELVFQGFRLYCHGSQLNVRLIQRRKD